MQDEEVRKAYEEILNSDSYKAAVKAMEKDPAELTDEEKENVKELYTKMATVKVEAENKYMDTEGFQLKAQTERSIVSRLQETVAPDWYKYGYNLQQQMNLGRRAAGTLISLDEPGARTTTGSGNPGSYGQSQNASDAINAANGGRPSAAVGMPTVPYDNYAAILHQGEMVLTASQARAYKDRAGGSVVVTGNSFAVREEADINKIAAQLARLINDAREGYIYA